MQSRLTNDFKNPNADWMELYCADHKLLISDLWINIKLKTQSINCWLLGNSRMVGGRRVLVDGQMSILKGGPVPNATF